MNHSIHLSPNEMSRLIVQAAVNADEQGYWRGPHGAAQDAVAHLSHFLGLLAGGDDDLSRSELDVFAQILGAASVRELDEEALRRTIHQSVRTADDPDALLHFLTSTPAYLEAVVAMDRERGTRNARQVVTALSGLALAVLAADGRAEAEEDSIFTTHLGHLRRLVDSLGVDEED